MRGAFGLAAAQRGELLGTVTLEADYTADVDSFRAELKRVLEDEGRALWDLRCLVREKLLAHLARHPDWLPQRRACVQEIPARS